MIRIISSRKFRLYSPDRQKNIVTEGKNIIQEIPDWAMEDEMFKVARNAGYIQVLSSRNIEKVAESTPEKIVPQNAHKEVPEPTWEPGGGAEVEEPEFPLNEEEEEVPAKKSRRKRSKRN